MFDWEHEPVYDWTERRSRANDLSKGAPTAPFAKNAVPAAVWKQMRETPADRDRVLSPLAVKWRAAFAPGLSPVHLCDRYPRIANRLALSWQDKTLARLILDSLLQDRRGGRQGFPPDVAIELQRLVREASGTPARPGPAR